MSADAKVETTLHQIRITLRRRVQHPNGPAAVLILGSVVAIPLGIWFFDNLPGLPVGAVSLAVFGVIVLGIAEAVRHEATWLLSMDAHGFSIDDQPRILWEDLDEFIVGSDYLRWRLRSGGVGRLSGVELGTFGHDRLRGLARQLMAGVELTNEDPDARAAVEQLVSPSRA